MKIETSIEVQPFDLPDGVRVTSSVGIRQEGIVAAPLIKLSCLSEETLNQLCDQFRREVFAKAGKKP